MTNKTTEALKLAEEALESAPIEYDFHGNPMDEEYGKLSNKALAAIREALADHFAASGKQIDEPVNRPPNCGTGYCSCIECPYEPVKPEPIAWEATSAGVIKFVTDSRYKKFSQNIQQYYKPYRCSHCSEPVKQEPVCSVCCKTHDKYNPVGFFYPPANEFDSWEQAAAYDNPNSVPLYAEPLQPVNQKPVAIIQDDNDGGQPYLKRLTHPLPPVGTKLYTTPLDAKAIRAEALEEAAKWCEVNGPKEGSVKLISDGFAYGIRGLK